MSRLIINEKQSNNQWVTQVTAEVTIGRHPGNDVVLSAPGVSRQHAIVIQDGDINFIIDKSSGNGTFLNGRKLKSGAKNPLRHGDVITIESYEIRYQKDESKLQEVIEQENTDSNIFEVRLLKKVLKAIDKDAMPSIEVLNGASKGKKVYLTDDMNEIIIGRDSENAMSLNDAAISRHHAKIIRRWGSITIRDLDSKNGVFLNDRRIIEETIHDGDRIALGNIVIMFRNPQEINVEQWDEFKPKAKPADIKPDDVPLASKNNKDNIQNNLEEDELESNINTDEAPKAEAPPPYIPEKKQESYPVPKIKAKLSAIELGMMGLGALVVLVSLITIANLMFD